MDKSNIKITIVGAGISGLATAFWLDKNGYDVRVLESKNEPGGTIETRLEKDFLMDFGPNSGLNTTPLITQIVEEVGLKDEMIFANPEGHKRYVLRNDRLHPLPMNPIAFIKTKLFSTKAKLRLFAEPFVKKSDDGYYQTISEFVTRRLGREFLDYAINPFVAGVFAGNPDNLSVKSAFPKLYRLEELYGGLFKGMILGARERAKRSETSKQNAAMFSFKTGMQALPKAIADKLGGKILFNHQVIKIEKADARYRVIFTHEGESKEILSDIVLSAVPAHVAASILGGKGTEIAHHLESIYYPPVKVLYVGFPKKAVGQDLDGFGFLIPAKENKSFLGAIWNSVIFPNRALPDQVSFTLFIGGARDPELLENENDILNKVLKEFKEIMRIHQEESPVFIKDKLWPKAIPQYHIGHIEHENYFKKFENDNPGIFLCGNYRGGISVGDCIINSELTFESINGFIETQAG